MKKSDILTFVGLGAGIGITLWGMSMGSSLLIFWDLSSVLLTVVGSFCAVLITYPMSDMKDFLKVAWQSFKDTENSPEALISNFVELSRKARKDGLLSLEGEISELKDEFLKKGLQMVIDGFDPEAIREILELELSETESRHLNCAGMWASWGVNAPAFGMLGTLIGLIQMLTNLSDMANLASGMGKALITTFYGSLIANMFCNPMAANLKLKNGRESTGREMVIEGVLAMQAGVNPKLMEEKLMSYLPPKIKKKYLEQAAREKAVQ